MRKLIVVFAAVAVLAATGAADDLYKITLNSDAEAQWLRATDAEPLVWVGGGYLVLANEQTSSLLQRSALDAQQIATGVNRDQLALDGREDRKNIGRYELLYEEEGVRLFRIKSGGLSQATLPPELSSLHNEHLKIEYHRPLPPTAVTSAPLDEISDVLDLVSTDSLWSFVEALQAFPPRTAGSEASRDARDWIMSKFIGFGYDSVYLDVFPAYFYDGYNVVACKPGTLYPERQIIVGGHFDAVSPSPGADDNGSGTAGTMEIARVLSNIDLPVTVIFIAFDAEEVGKLGSAHYAETAYDNGDDIIFMQNMDMIGFYNNLDRATLYHGPEAAFAVLWDEMGQTYGGISGSFAGTSTRSDHYSFQQLGYDVCFCIEYNINTFYHDARDSTTHMSPDYFTRMVQTSLATVYSASQMPRPVAVHAVNQVGDGQALQVVWADVQCPDRDHYRIGYYPTDNPGAIQYLIVAETDTVSVIESLTEGQEYAIFVQVFDSYGHSSLAFYREVFATPMAAPQMPGGFLAMPILDAVRLTWNGNNTELDFSHYAVYRNGQVAATTLDTTYDDDDPSIGADFHLYKIAAVDAAGIESDTIAMDAIEMRAATLQEDRFLAINRTQCCRSADLVDHIETGAFLEQALEGYNYDMYVDTFAVVYPFDMPQLDLVDMLDYGLVIVASEAARYDDVGLDPSFNGILDTLAYYTSIGGKLIMFGRWGTMYTYDTLDYLATSYDYDDAYHDYFHIDQRMMPLTAKKIPDTVICDLVGAKGVADGYPNLVWDSLLTLQHAQHGSFVVNHVEGIPCASHVQLGSGDAQVLYRYDSRNNDPNNEDKPVAWKYKGDDYSYIYFDIPLSMFDRATAITVLQNAIDDVTDTSTNIPVDEPDELPGSFVLSQNYPNPFNPSTRIEYTLPSPTRVKLTVYNLLGRKVAVLVDEHQEAGAHFIDWDGRIGDDRRAASGLYFYRLQTDQFDETKKMLLVK